MSETEGDRAPDPIDVHVGRRIRERRKQLGVSQERLADELGLTFQQVQKYERGANRVSASKLWRIGRALQIAVSAFYEGLPSEGAVPGVTEAGAPFEHEAAPPELRELAALLPQMDTRRRRMLLDLARALTESGAPPGD